MSVDLPRALEELVLWLLHKDPASRPASAAEVVERLTAIAELPPAGATVLSADASANTSEFGLARQLTRLGIALHPGLHRASVPRDSVVSQLLGSDRGGRGEGAWSPPEASQRQARTLSQMEKLLLGASEKNPTVILIDELHRADAESLAWIASLASEAKERALLLVLSVAAEHGYNRRHTSAQHGPSSACAAIVVPHATSRRWDRAGSVGGACVGRSYAVTCILAPHRACGTGSNLVAAIVFATKGKKRRAGEHGR